MNKFWKTFGIFVLSTWVIAAAAVSFVFLDNQRIVNTEYTVSDERIPAAFDGYRIVLITDYHNSAEYETVAKLARDAAPDVICLGGDLIDMNTTDYTNAIRLTERLSEIAPVYYTFGNHEIWSNEENCTETPHIAGLAKDAGAVLLNGYTVTLERDGEKIDLVGFKDYEYDDFNPQYKKAVRNQMDFLVAQKEDPARYSILVFHRAQYFPLVSLYPFDLVLSGHLHGGYVRLPGVMDLILEAHVGSSQYARGRYEKHGKTMIVCGGVDVKGKIPRVLNTPEIVTVELKCA